MFSISSLGLGHATRTLPVVRAYIGIYNVHVISTGSALRFLKSELEGMGITFYDISDYPPLERGVGVPFYFYLIVDSLRTIRSIKAEHAFVLSLTTKIDPVAIISDGRYGSYAPLVPSFLISHQISFVMPRGFGIFQTVMDYFNFRSFRKFDALFIPDYEDVSENLAGALSHHPMLRRIRHHYVGILSSLSSRDTPRDVDVLFSTGGFLSSQKPGLTEELMAQAKHLLGKRVFVLGNMKSADRKSTIEGIEVYEGVRGEERQKLFNRAKFVVTRGGYTTIMDLIELGRPALLLPTPGQTEQEYLARFLSGRGYFQSSDVVHVDVERALSRAGTCCAFLPKTKTREAVEKIRGVVAEHMKPHFFSIVIPAHNEEKYIGETLRRIQALLYPKDSYEVIVVENGSTDRTEEVARSFHGGNICVMVSDHNIRSVSKAKNFGFRHLSGGSDWTIFLDADTLLEKTFLAELDTYLRNHRKEDLSVGTSRALPYENKSRKARAWFRFYNFGHKLTKTSFAVQIAKTSLCKTVPFDEKIQFAEDLKFLTELRKRGNFFYLETDSLSTSTRRFDKNGWLRQFIIWNWEALVLAHSKRKTEEYEVIR